MEKVECILDNLVLYTDEVPLGGFGLLEKRVMFAQMKGLLPKEIRMNIGKGASEYHYRLNIGKGAGAITVSYKHNSAKSVDDKYTMRLEFNPQKSGEMHVEFFKIYNSLFSHHPKTVKQFDVAFDVPLNINSIFAYSFTGRDKSYFKNTLYFGCSGKHGRLKIYDKKKELEEQQGVVKAVEHLTRVEYTVKLTDALTVQVLSKLELQLNEEYKIVCVDLEKLSGETKACMLAVQSGEMQLKEFTRTTRKKIQQALESMVQLDLDHAYKSARQKIIKDITSLFSIT